jgi:hypothetical protein
MMMMMMMMMTIRNATEKSGFKSIDVRGSVHNSTTHTAKKKKKKNPRRSNSVSKFIIPHLYEIKF